MPKLKISLIRNILMVIIVLIILFQVLADTSADVGAAAGNVSQFNVTGDWLNSTHRNISGTVGVGDYEAYHVLPLVSFFKKKGVVLLAMIAGIVITVITAVLPKGK